MSSILRGKESFTPPKSLNKMSSYLSRILNFRRAPPCAGRVLNMTADIKMKTKDKDLLDTFFRDGEYILLMN